MSAPLFVPSSLLAFWQATRTLEITELRPSIKKAFSVGFQLVQLSLQRRTLDLNKLFMISKNDIRLVHRPFLPR